MLKYLFYNALLTLVLTILLTSAIAYSFDGPLQTKNQFPVFVHLNQFYLEKAAIENSWSVRVSNSTIHHIHEHKDWSIGLDLEMTELDFRARKIVFNSVELGADLPVLSLNSGFMDSPINFFHGLFGFPDYGRSYRPENDFLYDVKRKGVTIVKGEAGRSGISDIRLSAKKAIASPDQTVSFKLSLELPTGDARKGLGSGNFGTDATILLDKKAGDRLMTYTNIGIAFPGDLAGYETVNMRQFYFGGISLEMAAWKGINILSQLSFQGSPYPETGIRAVDATAVLFTVGAKYTNQSGGRYEFTFTEDPNAAGAPDFTVGLSYKRSYNKLGY